MLKVQKEIGMVNCECLEECIFFNDKMKNIGGLSDLYKKKYCHGDNATCARYVVFKTFGKSEVPSDLYPNMLDTANKIVNKK